MATVYSLPDSSPKPLNSYLSAISSNFIILSVFSYFIGILYAVKVSLNNGDFSYFSYKITQFHINYMDFGFARRGAIGTVLHPLIDGFSGNIDYEYLFIISFDFVLFIAVVWVAHRVLSAMESDRPSFSFWTRLALLIAPAGFMQFSYDVARYDHANYLIVFLALWLAAWGRPYWAGIAMAAGVLVHEAMFFYGLPVLVVLALLRAAPRREIALSLVPAVAAMALIALFGNIDADLAVVLGPDRAGGAEAWQRVVLEPASHLGFSDYALLAFYVGVPCYFLLRFARANGFSLPVFAGQLLFVCALFLLGVDYFRWAHLLFVSAVTTAAAILIANRKTALPATGGFERLVLALYVLPLGPIGVREPLPYVERIWNEVVMRLL